MPWNRAQKRAPPVRCGEPRRRDSLSQGIEETCFAAVAKAAKKSQLACKPGSVWLRLRRDETWQPFIWGCACAQPRATHPDDAPGNRLGACAPVSSLFGLAPGGVCRAVHVAMSAVGSYPTLSPLLRKRSGLLSVALSLGSPPPDVIRHRVSVEPGLSSPAAFRHLRGAAARPTGRGSLNDRDGKRQRNRHGRAVRRLLSDTRPRSPFRTRPPRAGRPPPAPRQACRSRRSSWQPGRCRL